MSNKPKDRTRDRALFSEFEQKSDHLGWFDALYQQAGGDEAFVPWAKMAPNLHLCEWHRLSGYKFHGKRCLIIGCGLGDDAEYLASAGASVTAFDISPAAIEWCRRRFPASEVIYTTADLFKPATDWHRAFDFVFESYTLQALPSDIRQKAMQHIADFVNVSGALLLICRGREEADPPGAMPWPLTRRELQSFSEFGLRELAFEDYDDTETPPVRRFRVQYHRPTNFSI